MRSRITRYLLTLILPAALLCLVFVYSLYHEERMMVRQNLEAEEELRLLAGARSLGGDIGSIVGDVRLMASLPGMQAVLETGDAPALAASRRVYDQLRWVDASGVERVRIDYVQNKPLIVPEERLQNLANRYFFSATIKLGPGEIFVLPLDLNVEDGQVEKPIKPVIRFAMPVRDEFGTVRGIVMANYYGVYLLEKFADVTEAREGSARVSLLNGDGDGYWLRAYQPGDEWGFMFGRKEHFGTRFPAAWERISTGERGRFEDADGLWSFTTVRPLLAGMASAREAPLGVVPVAADEYVWKAVSCIPPDLLMQTGNRNAGGWVMITLVFLAALGIGAYMLARAQQAVRDPLTGLYNRRYLDETLPREVHRALRDNQGLAVVMIDLDNFKSFNDQWRHEAGDLVLLGVAEALLDGLRASDIACRYGGEEILVVMPGADAEEAVKRISAIAAHVRTTGARVMGRGCVKTSRLCTPNRGVVR